MSKKIENAAPKPNPYVGPRPFFRNLEDQNRFYGRHSEIDRIITLIYCHQLILLYSQSGAGKTSLLNAQIIPLLERDSFYVLPIARVRSYLQRERDIISPANSNFYLLNTMVTMAPEINLSSIENMSFHDFLNSYFSLRKDMRGKPCYQVIIFDQLEEMFTTYPENWGEQRVSFFKEISKTLEKNPFLRVIFVIREEYLAQLDPFVPLLPEQLRARFRLEPLRREDALLAVTEPLGNAGLSFRSGVAEKLVDDLMKIRVVEASSGHLSELKGDFVEPIQLQVVCQRLWNKLIHSEVNQVSIDYLGDLGDVDKALEEFYEDAINEASRTTGTKDIIRKWFEEKLITPTGTRSLVYKGSESTGGLSNNIVDVLENKYLIRKELSSGAQWYELTHDRLINAIKNSNRRFQINKEKAKVNSKGLKRYFSRKS